MPAYNQMNFSGRPEMQMPTPYGIMPQTTTPMISATPAQQLPTGVPAGPTTSGSAQIPQTIQSPLFLPGYLRTQIGRRMRVEFLIGTNAPLIDRTGTLIGVGSSYILLRPIDSDDIMLCDLYSIKFVTILL